MTLTIDERRKYRSLQCARYRRTGRAGRSQLLTEIEHGTRLHRKRLVGLLATLAPERQPRRRQRGPAYGMEVRTVLATAWESLDYIGVE